MQGRRPLSSATGGEVRAGQGATTQVQCRGQLQRRGRVGRMLIATARPDRGQGRGQRDDGAVQNVHPRKAAQDRDGGRVGGQDLVGRGAQQLLEKAGGGRLIHALIEPLRSDGHTQGSGGLGQRFATGLRVGQEAEHKRLDKVRATQFGGALHKAGGTGTGIGGRGEHGLHSLADLWYGKHIEAPVVWDGCSTPIMPHGLLLVTR